MHPKRIARDVWTYRYNVQAAVDALKAKGVYDATMFTPSGPGGIFGLYVNPGSNLGYVLVNEFVCVRARPSP